MPPGDFATTYKTFLIQTAGLTEDRAEEMTKLVRQQYGLDQPVYVQFFTWVKGIVTEGKFGYSFAYRKDAGEIILDRLPKTMMLALLAHADLHLCGIFCRDLCCAAPIWLGRQYFSLFAFILTSIPRFFMALGDYVCVGLYLSPASCHLLFSPEYAVAPWSWAKFLDLARHVWPVILIAGLGGVVRNMRVMRGNLLDVLNAQYVTTARSKGLPENG